MLSLAMYNLCNRSDALVLLVHSFLSHSLSLVVLTRLSVQHSAVSNAERRHSERVQPPLECNDGFRGQEGLERSRRGCAGCSPVLVLWRPASGVGQYHRGWRVYIPCFCPLGTTFIQRHHVM